MLLQQISLEMAGVRRLAGIDLSLRQGRIYALLGANGAGKTLVLKLMAGLLTPKSGQVLIDPREVHYLSQQALFLRRSAQENLRYCQHLRPGLSEALISTTLQKFQLQHCAHQLAHTLSGGEQQRLALARATLLSPKWILLDEPTAALDPVATQSMEQAMLALAQAGTGLVLVTHSLGQAKRMADVVLFLHQGRITEQTDKKVFFSSPTSAEAQAYMREELGAE
ncbi:MAG: hypothetical protein RLZZ502_1783 [Pseudomonadota bacterium]